MALLSKEQMKSDEASVKHNDADDEEERKVQLGLAIAQVIMLICHLANHPVTQCQ